MIDVIIVKYNAPKLEKKCISSVVNVTHADTLYSLRVFNNYPANANLSMVWNRLIGQSLSDYICLLNSDTRITDPKWLMKLINVFKKEKSVGAVGPVTNCSGNPQEEAPVSKYNVYDYGERYKRGYLCGFCLVFPKKVWRHVGGFPENFGFYGQEAGFLYKVQASGLKQMVRRDVFVWHKGGGSARRAEKMGELNIKKELEQGREKCRVYFNTLFKNGE